MKNLVDFTKEQGEIILNVTAIDFNGKLTRRKDRVGYRFEKRVFIKAMTALSSHGGSQKVDKMIFTVKPGKIRITTRQGVHDIVGDYKVIIAEFMAHIGKMSAATPQKPTQIHKPTEKSAPAIKKVVVKKKAPVKRKPPVKKVVEKKKEG